MHAQDQAASTAATVIADVVDKYDTDLIDLRRDLHAHPELSWSELRTAELVAARVEQAGWRVTRYSRTGFAADLGDARAARRAARRHGRAAGPGPHRRPLGQHGRRASRTPAATTCTRPR